jgi:hypothetical protein
MLEALETRDCPSLAITNFNATPTNNVGRQVELKGTVSGSAFQETVQFTGQVSATIGVDASGNFDYVGSAGGLGTVTAVASGMTPNYQHVTSAPATALITSMAPVITSFNVVAAGAGCWTFSGHVSDESPMGIAVQFGGAYQVAGLYATCDANGNFSATFYLPNLANTDVSASCQDVWGLLSNTVCDPIV